MTARGSDVEAGIRARAGVLELGGSRLDALYAGFVAEFGTNGCWMHDRKVAPILGCHPKSLPRTRRRLGQQGTAEHDRIMPGGELPRVGTKPPNRSAHGTTHTRIRWRALNWRPSKREGRRASADHGSTVDPTTSGSRSVRPLAPPEERPAASALANVIAALNNPIGGRAPPGA